MAHTSKRAVKAMEATRFVESMIPEGWKPTNRSTNRNTNISHTLDRDLILKGSNGEVAHLKAHTELVIFHPPGHSGENVMASFFPMPAQKREFIVNIKADGSIAFRSCVKNARPASRSVNRRQSLL